MGEEIRIHEFTPADIAEFEARLARETEMLGDWFARGELAEEHPVGGFEVEAWLIDGKANPLPINNRFLAMVNSPDIVPELSRYNVEINTPPPPLAGSALSRMHDNLRRTLARSNSVARKLDAELLMTGILPTLRDEHLSMDHMSTTERFRALNDQIIRSRRGAPIRLDIAGADKLQSVHRDVMLEAATTSFQIHIQAPQSNATRYYNASIIASAPMVALTANSPFLFGRDLWDETRIPLFEQAVSITPNPRSNLNRATFGGSFVEGSLHDVFRENARQYTALLPALMDGNPEELRHLRLQNGTLWRWNRPLIGFDDDGAPHLRIEHRAPPAGPSVADSIANAAFYFGLTHAMASDDSPPESRITFQQARDNFYTAAKDGLRAEITWLDKQYVSLHELIWERLASTAESGLLKLGLDAADVDLYMEIIEARLRTGRNGTHWQRRFVAQHGGNMQALAQAYRDNQQTGNPVHEWKL